jgi:DNA-binding transcriptional regulator YhcF (GntR family)
MDIRIDRDLPVPVKTQIAGQVEYAICYGELSAGERLPRVHELAQALQVSPVTVSHAYAELRQRGLIHSRRGLGTFVTDDARYQAPASAAMAALAEALQRVRVMARALDVDRAHLHQMLESAFQESAGSAGLELGHVGVFKVTTAAYAAAVARQLGQDDRIDAWAIDELQTSREVRELLARRDAVLCLPNLVPQVRELLGTTVRVFDVPVVPSDATAERLKAISPRSAVGVIAAFPEFLPVIKRGVRVLAPGLRIVGACVDDPDEIAALLPHCDALVVASGCVVPNAGIETVEFMHAPDARHIRDVLAPQLAALRAERIVATGT